MKVLTNVAAIQPLDMLSSSYRWCLDWAWMHNCDCCGRDRLIYKLSNCTGYLLVLNQVYVIESQFIHHIRFFKTLCEELLDSVWLNSCMIISLCEELLDSVWLNSGMIISLLFSYHMRGASLMVMSCSKWFACRKSCTSFTFYWAYCSSCCDLQEIDSWGFSSLLL